MLERLTPRELPLEKLAEEKGFRSIAWLLRVRERESWQRRNGPFQSVLSENFDFSVEPWIFSAVPNFIRAVDFFCGSEFLFGAADFFRVLGIFKILIRFWLFLLKYYKNWVKIKMSEVVSHPRNTILKLVL